MDSGDWSQLFQLIIGQASQGVQQGTVDITARDVWLQLEVNVHLQLCDPAGHLIRQTVELILVTVISESSDVPHVAHRTAVPATSSTVLILSLKIDNRHAPGGLA